MANLTATTLRQNLFSILDSVVLYGKTPEIKRKGKKIKIVLYDKVDKFKNLVPHKSIIGDPEDLVKIKAYSWKEPKNL